MRRCWRSRSASTSSPRAAATSSAATVAPSPARAAAPTDAYWRRMSSIAFADHGSSSQSSTSQPVASSSHSPAAPAAARTRPSAASVSAARIEERAARARVDRAGLAVVDPEALAGDAGVATDDDDRPRAHVLLLADHARHAGAAVLGERVLGMLEQVGPRRGRGRRHRRRQVDEPARVGREAAHDLQRGGRVLRLDRDGAGEPRAHDPLAGDIVDVEQERGPVDVRRRRRRIGEKRLGRLVVRARRRAPTRARARASAARSAGRRRRSPCRC